MTPLRYLLFFILMIATAAYSAPPWTVLPPTPTLPKADENGYASINGIRIWYAIFGQGQPVILLHGGLANSNYWGNQVPVFAKHYKIIVIDSRGHGHSTRDSQPYSYDQMASDVIGVMDALKIKKATMIGWSDGAIIGLTLAIHYPERLSKLFAFAANSNPNGVEPSVSKSALTKAYLARSKTEYEHLSSTPTQYSDFLAQINNMWETQPNFTEKQLQAIKIPIWIVDGNHDEAIKRSNTEYMAAVIPNARLLIQPNVGHFSFLQDPQQFNHDALRFLEDGITLLHISHEYEEKNAES